MGSSWLQPRNGGQNWICDATTWHPLPCIEREKARDLRESHLLTGERYPRPATPDRGYGAAGGKESSDRARYAPDPQCTPPQLMIGQTYTMIGYIKNDRTKSS